MSPPHNYLPPESAPDANPHLDLTTPQALPPYNFTSQNLTDASPSAYPLSTTTPHPYSTPSSPSPAHLHNPTTSTTGPGTLLAAYAPCLPDLSSHTQSTTVQASQLSMRGPSHVRGTMAPPPVPMRAQARWQRRLRATGPAPQNPLATEVLAGPGVVVPRAGVLAGGGEGSWQWRSAPPRVSQPWYPCDGEKYMEGWGGWSSEGAGLEAAVAGAGFGAGAGAGAGGGLGFEPGVWGYGAQGNHAPPAPSPWAVGGGGDVFLLGPDTQWGTPVMGRYMGLLPGAPPVAVQPVGAWEGGLGVGGLQYEGLAHAGEYGERAQAVLERTVKKTKPQRGVRKTAGSSRASVVHARRQERLVAEQVQRALRLPGAPQQQICGLAQPSPELTAPFGAQEQAFVDLTHSPEAAEPSAGGREHATEQQQVPFVQQEQVAKDKEQASERDDDQAWDVEFLRVLTEDIARMDEAGAKQMMDSWVD